MKVKCVSTHPEDLAPNGRIVGIGEETTLTAAEAKHDHNKQAIADGRLLEIPSRKKEA